MFAVYALRFRVLGFDLSAIRDGYEGDRPVLTGPLEAGGCLTLRSIHAVLETTPVEQISRKLTIDRPAQKQNRSVRNRKLDRTPVSSNRPFLAAPWDPINGLHVPESTRSTSDAAAGVGETMGRNDVRGGSNL